MLKWLDKTCCILLALLGAAHGILGSLMSFPLTVQTTIWHFSGSIAVWLIVVLHWLRSGRPGDTALAAWAIAGSMAWIAIMAWLMQVEEAWNDPRPWSFVIVCAVLAASAIGQFLGAARAPVGQQAR